MKIELFVGDGWAPFAGGVQSWPAPRVEGVDWQISVEKLADVFVERVREIYPDAEVTVAPLTDGGGRLARVMLDDDATAEADDALALTAEDLESGGYAPGMIIAGEIEGLLDGLIRERPHTWLVEAEM